jgi:hypothetical protein
MGTRGNATDERAATAVWLSTGAEPRARDRKAEARQLFIPGGLVLAAATAAGVALLWSSGPSGVAQTVAAAPSKPVVEPVRGRGMPAQGVAGTADPLPSPTQTADGGADTMPVVVLDDTGSDGSGTKVADTLRQDGWSVSQVGTFSGSAKATTVYYPRGMRSAGREVALALPGEQRMRVRPDALPNDAVTVVVAGDYET